MNVSQNNQLASNTIMFVINTLQVGGAAKMIKYVSNLSVEWFKEVQIVVLYDDSRDMELDDRINSYTLGIRRSNVFWRLKAILKLRKIIKTNKPTMVCTFVSDVCVLSRFATLGINTKVISAERGDPYTLGPLWSRLVSWTYRNSDYCFFQLERARDFFGEKVARKSFVIPNVFNSASLSLENITRKQTIVSAGRFVEEKRYEVLIEAFNKVHQLYPSYKLIIYGDGPYREIYEDLVQKLNLSDAVSFPGYIKNVAQAISNDGIFVLSSRYEGIPNSLIEALSVGIPTVATDCTPGGPAYLTMNGKNGLLIPVDDVDAMSSAIVKIIESPVLQRELSILGPSILAQLTPERISQKWKNAFEQINN